MVEEKVFFFFFLTNMAKNLKFIFLKIQNRLEKDFRQRNENSLKSAFSLNQEYDRVKNEISMENLRIQEIKAKNDEMKQSHDFKVGDIGKAKNELAVWKEKMNKLKEEKSYLNLKVFYYYYLYLKNNVTPFFLIISFC